MNEETVEIGLTREDVCIYLRRTRVAQRLAYRAAHHADESAMYVRSALRAEQSAKTAQAHEFDRQESRNA